MQTQADLLGRPVRVADVARGLRAGRRRALASRRTSGTRPADDRRDDGRDVRPALDEPGRHGATGRLDRRRRPVAVATSRHRPRDRPTPRPKGEDPRDRTDRAQAPGRCGGARGDRRRRGRGSCSRPSPRRRPRSSASDPEAAAAAGGSTFDAVEYAQEHYDSEVVPTIHENAEEIAELLPQIVADPDAAGEKYGHRAGVSSPYAYAVTGEGVAGEFDGTLLPVTIEGSPSTSGDAPDRPGDQRHRAA